MSTNKTATRPRTTPVKIETLDNPQSAVERRSAEAELRALITKFSPTNLRLISTVRRSLKKHMPTAHEIVYEYANLGAVVISFSPSVQGYDGVIAIRADGDSLKLYFNQGKSLSDPEKLLQGAAQARWIPIEGASTIRRPAILRLIEEAMTHNRVPFTSLGRGSVIIRPTATKKSQRPKK